MSKCWPVQRKTQNSTCVYTQIYLGLNQVEIQGQHKILKLKKNLKSMKIKIKIKQTGKNFRRMDSED